MKLFKDFGVSALLATMVVGGGLTYLIIGLVKGLIDVNYATIVIASWVSSALSAYLTVKAVKTSKNNEGGEK